MDKQLTVAATLIAAAASHALARKGRPVLVALDGPSGAGKSTLAAAVAEIVGAGVVPSDDFFAASIPAEAWDRRTPAERARDALDWKRLRREALEPLLAGETARWRSFDFDTQRPDGSYPPASEVTERSPAPVIILDGAYSTRPELADLIDVSVLVEAPAEVRQARLRGREEGGFLGEWHERWDSAEAYYFSHERPRAAFDLVVTIG